MKLENGEDDSAVDLNGGGGGYLKKGPWTAAEDDILLDYVHKSGEGNWNSVQKNTGLLRCGKSCRLRWTNHLRPNLKKGSLTADEERLILDLHSKLGNKWARMAAHLPGRTDNEIKNYWNTRIKRRQRAGLPVYPIGIHKQAGASHPRQHHHPHFSPAAWSRIAASSSFQPKQNQMSPMPIFDQMNMSSPTAIPSHHHTNPFPPVPVHGFKRFGGNGIGFSFPFSPPHPPSLSPLQFTQTTPTQFPQVPMHRFNDGNYDVNPPPILQTPYEPDGLVLPGLAVPVKSELPSNQFPEPAADVAALGSPRDDYKMYMQLAETNSGLLDALVQEAEAMTGSEGTKLEGKCRLDGLVTNASPPVPAFDKVDNSPSPGFARQCGDLSSSDCYFGAMMKKEPIDDFNYFNYELSSLLPTPIPASRKMKDEPNHVFESEMNELSSLLDIIPSMPYPEWGYSDSGEMSIGESSGGTDNNNISLEMQQMVSSLPPVPTAIDHDWSLGPWNNMPGIC